MARPFFNGDTMKVKFVSDAVAITEKGAETLFSTGDVQDLNSASADRWIRRGIAVVHSGPSAEPAPTSKKVSKKSRKK